MNERENKIRAWKKQKPDWIPISCGFVGLDWAKFGYDIEEFENMILKHKILFPNFVKGNLQKGHENVKINYPHLIEDKPYTDYWGSVWETKSTGMVGTVVKHALEDWENFKGYKPPNPEDNDGMLKIDWDRLNKYSTSTTRESEFFSLSLTHGHTYLRAQDLRGYVNLVYDMEDEEPMLDELMDMICDFNCRLIDKFLKLNPDCISIPEDLGMQNTPMLSPSQFRRYISPIYDKMTKPIKDAGIIVHEHSDGYIMDLIDELISKGGTVINLQDLVNGIDNIAKYVKGRISIDLDIDRQNVTAFGSKKDIDDHIKECVTKLSTKEGGLSLLYQPWPYTPIANMDAAFSAMEKYCVTDYK